MTQTTKDEVALIWKIEAVIARSYRENPTISPFTLASEIMQLIEVGGYVRI